MNEDFDKFLKIIEQNYGKSYSLREEKDKILKKSLKEFILFLCKKRKNLSQKFNQHIDDLIDKFIEEEILNKPIKEEYEDYEFFIDEDENSALNNLSHPMPIIPISYNSNNLKDPRLFSSTKVKRYEINPIKNISKKKINKFVKEINEEIDLARLYELSTNYKTLNFYTKET